MPISVLMLVSPPTEWSKFRPPILNREPGAQVGAFQRQRQIQGAGDLLRGLLAYVLGPLSFRGLGDLCGSAWRRRLRCSSRRLEWLVTELLVEVVPLSREAGQMGGRRVVLVDATCLKQPGGSGKDWKLHLAYDLTLGRLCGRHLDYRHPARGYHRGQSGLWLSGKRGMAVGAARR